MMSYLSGSHFTDTHLAVIVIYYLTETNANHNMVYSAQSPKIFNDVKILMSGCLSQVTNLRIQTLHFQESCRNLASEWKQELQETCYTHHDYATIRHTSQQTPSSQPPSWSWIPYNPQTTPLLIHKKKRKARNYVTSDNAETKDKE